MTPHGYLIERALADGLFIAIAPMTFGKGRIILGDEYGVHDGWCYQSLAQAFEAFERWNPALTDEPEGWFRHPASGRRRPDGDPSQEHVYL